MATTKKIRPTKSYVKAPQKTGAKKTAKKAAKKAARDEWPEIDATEGFCESMEYTGED